ncbi:MAG: radical SAM family heme chaperone HemW [Desulfobacteraceae bacterium]|nr:radical SAM family heme chaperone HemW [Desulfobacteraceae bacterium]
MSDDAAGLYLHVPFCERKCRYCDFYSITDRSLIPAYVDGVCAEAATVRAAGVAFDTIYIGGGTPSLLHPREVGRILDRLGAAFSIAATSEVTLEVNPGTVDAASLAGHRTAGVNRLSIGVQSFHEEALQRLGRIHSREQALAAVAAAQKAGYSRISLDLIYGIPGQSERQWQRDLVRAASLGPGHLSCYLLTTEPGTPLHADVDSGIVSMPEETVQGDLFSFTRRFLTDLGYRPYEISNFARTSADRSRHNEKYWKFAPYTGLGPAAHSFDPPRRWWNHRDLQRWLQDVRLGRPPVAGMETLDREQQMIERVYLGLRTAEGIDPAAFEREFGIDVFSNFGPILESLARERLLEVSDTRLALTAEGMRFHESVSARLIEAI